MFCNKVDINTKEIKYFNRFENALKTSFLEKYKELSFFKSNCHSCKLVLIIIDFSALPVNWKDVFYLFKIQIFSPSLRHNSLNSTLFFPFLRPLCFTFL